MSIRNFFKPKDAVQALASASKAPSIVSRAGKKGAPVTEPESEDPECVEKPAKKARSMKDDSVNSTAEKAVSSDDSAAANKTLSDETLAMIQKKKEAALAKKKTESVDGGSGSSPSSVPPAGKAGSVLEAASLLPSSWKEILGSEFSNGYFKSLDQFVRSEIDGRQKVYPPISEVFTAFHLCPFDMVSVVIVGQDPYHGPGQAHGLAFSVQNGVTPPPSLVNMYKELEEDPKVQFKRPKHGCLAKWAQQGVFMLNTVLTVRESQPNSHQKKGWEQFTDAVISNLNKRSSGLVFVLWGKPAEVKCKSVDGKKHVILKAPHPSPLSASRGFFGCRHFSKINEHLKAIGRPVIDWQL